LSEGKIRVSYRFEYKGYPVELEADLSELGQIERLRDVLEAVMDKIDEWKAHAEISTRN